MSSKKPAKKPTAKAEFAIWYALPATIDWLRKGRDNTVSTQNELIGHGLHKGVNSTIILLSACCIEGFLVGCLKWAFDSPPFPLQNENLAARMSAEYYQKASIATFEEIRELFPIAFGKPLSEIVKNESILEGVRALISFRNGIAHSRPMVFHSYNIKQGPVVSIDDYEYELSGQYGNIKKYLTDAKLHKGTDSIFTDKIANHFSDLVAPYISEVMTGLDDYVKAIMEAQWIYALKQIQNNPVIIAKTA